MSTAKKLAVLLLVATLVMWSAGLAAAASLSDIAGTKYEQAVNDLVGLKVLSGYPDGTFKPANPVTRAELAKILVLASVPYGQSTADALKNASSRFKDVKPGDWFNGFVQVADSLGIVKGYPDGTFKPNDNVSYQDAVTMILRAAGYKDLAYPDGYKAQATLSGITTGTNFVADLPANRGDIALMADATIFNVKNPTSGKTLAESVFDKDLTAPVIQVAGVADGKTYNTAVTPVFVADKGTVTATLSKDGGTPAAFTSGTTVDKAGSYVLDVKAVSASGKTSETTVSFTLDVWGAPASVALVGPSQITANNASTATFTVKVLDADGNVVKDFDQTGWTATVADSPSQGAVVWVNATTGLPDTNASAPTLTFTNGVATFQVGATQNPSATDTLVVTLTKGTTTLTASADISSTTQKATSLSIKSDRSELSADGTSYAGITATVLDQDGQPMLNGGYTITFSIAGPGSFTSGTSNTAAQTVSTASSTATTTVFSVYNQEGTITVSASATGLTGASTTIGSYVTYRPSLIQVSASKGTLQDDGVNGAGDYVTLTIKLLDRAGHLVTTAADQYDGTHHPALLLKTSNGNVVFYSDSGRTSTTTTVSTVNGQATVYAFGDAGSSDAKLGAVTVTVYDPSTTNALTSGTASLTLVPGPAAKIVFVAPGTAVNVPISNPSIVVKAQLEDAAGNAVSQAGVSVKFTATKGTSNKGNATWPLVSGTPTTYATTDASGVAVATFSAQGYADDQYTVEAYADIDGDQVYAQTEKSTGNVAIKLTDANVAATLKLDIQSGSTSVTTFSADSQVTLKATVYDGNSNLVKSADSVVFSTKLANGTPKTLGTVQLGANNSGTGVATLTISGADLPAGSYIITATDTNAPTTVSASRALYVTAGQLKQLVLDPTFNDGNTVYTAGKVYGAYTLTLADQHGNAVPAPVAGSIGVSVSGNAEVRATAGGAKVNSFAVAAGQSTVSFYLALADNYNGVKVTFTPSFTGYSFNPASTDATIIGSVASYVFSPSPIAGTGTITLTAEDGAGNAVPNATVYLSFTAAAATTPATASVGSTQLNTMPASFTTGTDGTISITYTAGTGAATGAKDTITAQNAATQPTVSGTDTYTY